MNSKKHLIFLLTVLIGFTYGSKNRSCSCKTDHGKSCRLANENHDDLKYRAQNQRLSRGKHHLWIGPMVRFM